MNVRSCTETTNAVAFVANKGERAKCSYLSYNVMTMFIKSMIILHYKQ